MIYLFTNKYLLKMDPYNTFDWILDLYDEAGLKSAFYFMSNRTNLAYDVDYDLESPAINQLMKKIFNRGHEIGLHPSFETFDKPELIVNEANRLKKVCSNLGIEQDVWGRVQEKI